MHVREIWRYPVKSMGGEPLDRAVVKADGIEGDRAIQVVNAGGRVVTARTFPGLLGFRAATDRSGAVTVDGKPWDSPEVRGAVEAVVGAGAHLVRDESPERFDILPLLVATDGSIEAFGRDGRRLRPNLVIGGVPGLEERTWEGRRLSIGAVEIGIHDLRGRCIMTTFDPDTLAHDPAVLRDIVRRFGGRLALNCDVIRTGEIGIGQAARVE